MSCESKSSITWWRPIFGLYYWNLTWNPQGLRAYCCLRGWQAFPSLFNHNLSIKWKVGNYVWMICFGTFTYPPPGDVRQKSCARVYWGIELQVAEIKIRDFTPYRHWLRLAPATPATIFLFIQSMLSKFNILLAITSLWICVFLSWDKMTTQRCIGLLP